MPSISSKGQNLLNNENGSSGSTDIEHLILAALSERGSMTREELDSMFFMVRDLEPHLVRLSQLGQIV